MSRRLAIIIQIVLIGGITLAGLALSSCTTTITPPVDPVDPVVVYIVDYGRHASLLLPKDEGQGLIEYAYGEWGWFALDRSRWHDVFRTLLWPSRGALGRWEWDLPADVETIRAGIFCEDVLQVIVASERERALLVRLDARHAQHADTLHYQPLYQLEFVHDDDEYHLFHNCNHVLARWLRELDCDVHGWAMFADFVVHEHDD
jgi:hypothetical protein